VDLEYANYKQEASRLLHKDTRDTRTTSNTETTEHKHDTHEKVHGHGKETGEKPSLKEKVKSVLHK